HGAPLPPSDWPPTATGRAPDRRTTGGTPDPDYDHGTGFLRSVPGSADRPDLPALGSFRLSSHKAMAAQSWLRRTIQVLARAKYDGGHCKRPCRLIHARFAAIVRG